MEGADIISVHVHTEDKPGKAVGELSRLIRQCINDGIVAQGGSITPEQGRILGYLDRCGGSAAQKAIEETFGVKRSSTTSILANLEKAGFIERSSDCDDLRKKTVSLTEKGTAAIDRIDRAIGGVEAQLTCNFSDEEKHLFTELLHKAEDNLKKGTWDKW